MDDADALPSEDESPTVRLVSTLLTRAMHENAEAVHIEPTPDGRLAVRFRADGTLFHALEVPAELAAPFLGRLKVISELDIAEHRLPQDGRFTVRVGDELATFAVSTLPTASGEAAVLRRLDPSPGRLEDLGGLGYTPQILALLRSALASPGLVVLAGPTHSGRHTTAYAALASLAGAGVAIATAEDPVRRPLAGVRQVSVDDPIGMSFAAALRVFLRHDVDVIGLGDLRDFETTELAFLAAHRGKTVVASAHIQSARGSVARFLDMGVEPWIIAHGLSLVLGLRLLRQLCARCRAAEPAGERALAALGVPAAMAASATLFRKVGCDDCHRTGFSGRLPVAEAFVVDDAVRAAIRAGSPIAESVVPSSLRAQALALACQGTTTIEEALFATPPADGP